MPLQLRTVRTKPHKCTFELDSSAGALYDLVNDPEEGVVVLDVRTADGLSVRPYQICGTRWLPLAEVVQQADTLPRPRTIVTYCT